MDHSSPMFKRRQKRSFLRRIKELLWPSMGWRRAGHYLALRILRLSDADGHDVIAQSVAWGIGMSFFPILGVHALMAGAAAALFRLKIIVSVIGTLIIPPVVLPVLFSIDFLVGRKILNALGFYGWGKEASFNQNVAGNDWTWLADHFYELFVPALIGFLIFLPMAWCAGYMLTHKIMDILRARYNRKHKGAPV
ncbi:MAG TPA: DUF2062 domain-containing protein [Alphaproteobacteria bacterium]